MIDRFGLFSGCRRVYEMGRMFSRSASCRGERLTLSFPPAEWYRENSAQMLRIAEDTAAQLDAYARSRVAIDPRKISRMHRYAGRLCSRSSWLSTHP